eukprot:8896839-Pyramimonas_sp.AAC.1
MFESQPSSRRKLSNKELLLETCRVAASIIGNACFRLAVDDQITYYEPAPGVDASSPPSPEHVARIDFCPVGAAQVDMVEDIWGDR